MMWTLVEARVGMQLALGTRYALHISCCGTKARQAIVFSRQSRMNCLAMTEVDKHKAAPWLASASGGALEYFGT
jgi:hypothetical protein